MDFTTIIDEDSSLSKQIVVLDAKGNVVKYLKSYDTKTQLAIVYRIDDKRNIIKNKDGDFVLDHKILKGSYIGFINI